MQPEKLKKVQPFYMGLAVAAIMLGDAGFGVSRQWVWLPLLFAGFVLGGLALISLLNVAIAGPRRYLYVAATIGIGIVVSFAGAEALPQEKHRLVHFTAILFGSLAFSIVSMYYVLIFRTAEPNGFIKKLLVRDLLMLFAALAGFRLIVGLTDSPRVWFVYTMTFSHLAILGLFVDHVRKVQDHYALNPVAGLLFEAIRTAHDKNALRIRILFGCETFRFDELESVAGAVATVQPQPRKSEGRRYWKKAVRNVFGSGGVRMQCLDAEGWTDIAIPFARLLEIHDFLYRKSVILRRDVPLRDLFLRELEILKKLSPGIQPKLTYKTTRQSEIGVQLDTYTRTRSAREPIQISPRLSEIEQLWSLYFLNQRSLYPYLLFGAESTSRFVREMASNMLDAAEAKSPILIDTYFQLAGIKALEKTILERLCRFAGRRFRSVEKAVVWWKRNLDRAENVWLREALLDDDPVDACRIFERIAKYLSGGDFKVLDRLMDFPGREFKLLVAAKRIEIKSTDDLSAETDMVREALWFDDTETVRLASAAITRSDTPPPVARIATGRLIDLLECGDSLIAMAAIEALRESFGFDFGYNPFAESLRREIGIQKWRSWFGKLATESRIERLQIAAQIDELNPGIFKLLGKEYMAAGNARRALDYFFKALAVDLKFTSVLVWIGRAQLACGNHRRAREFFQKAMRARPQDPEVYFELGRLELEQGAVSDARKHLVEGVRIHPFYLECHEALGSLFLKTREYKKLLLYMSRAARFAPENVSIKMKLGIACANLGEIDSARSIFEDIVRHDPNNAEAAISLGNIMMEQADYAGASAVFDRIVRRNPKNAAALRARIGALRQLGRIAEAAPLLEEIIELDPYDLNAYRELAFILKEHYQNNILAKRYCNIYLNLGGADEEIKRLVRELDELY